jgi:NADPH2:quinone reductase
MPHAIRFHKTGGPEVLQWEDVSVAQPGPGECLIRHKAVGLNYIDTYHRTGLYPMPLPSGIGLEAAGVVEAVGSGVTEFKAGDRVAYCNGPIGAYSEAKIHPADRLVKLPEGISFEQGASMMLQGLTVQYLIRRLHLVPKAGDTILWHAAAGGVGLIACQWARALGVNLIGTVSSEEKAKLARDNGAAHTIIYTKEDFVARVGEITGGKKVPVVYDSVGKDTFLKSLDCLQTRGLLALFGNSSGPVEALNTGLLAAKGSLYVTRPTLMGYVARRDELVAAAKELFDLVLAGKIKVGPRQSYALKDAAQAHRDLEARKTTGSTILVP